jgi:CelD/BcsL family acetyltransferase involved in cellulose biosynthesis
VIEIETITDPACLAVLRPEWERLWQRDPAATPFQTPGWMLAWWRFFGTGEPLVLTARERGTLVGLLPLYLLQETAGAAKLLPIGVGLSDYIDALTDPAVVGVGDTLLAAIAKSPDWCECWLPDLVPERGLAIAPAPLQAADRSAPAWPCPVLELPADRSKLARVVPRKTIRDLHQARTRAAAAGPVVTEAIGGDRLDAAIDDLFRLHRQRWRSRGEPGVCEDPDVQRFHRAAAHALLDAGMLRFYRLWIGDAVGAVYYGFVAKGRAYAYLGGFDPSRPRLSPGAQVLAHAIEQATAEAATSFDFLRGREPYKYAWGAVDRPKMSRKLCRR